MKMGKKLLAAVVLALPLSMTACGGKPQSRPEFGEMFVNTQIGRLQDEDAKSRFCAVRALANVRCPAVQKAVPPLRCLLYDVNHDVRREAERALRNIEPRVIEIGRNETSESPL